MQGFKECGDAKTVALTIRAIAYFHKTVQEFLETVKPFTQEQRVRYSSLLVAEYQQFQNTDSAEKRVQGRKAAEQVE